MLDKQLVHVDGWGDPTVAQKLNEVRAELGFIDMQRLKGPETRVVNQFRTTIPRTIAVRAERWLQIGCHFEAQYKLLMRSAIDHGQRTALVDQLREETAELGGEGGW